MVTFRVPHETPPAHTATTRVQMKAFPRTRPEDAPGPVLPVADLPQLVRETFAAFADRLPSDGFAFLRTQMQEGTVGPVLAVTDADRIGFLFLATEWEGIPVSKEPEKCLALQWFADHDLPEDIIEYPAAGLRGCLNQDGALTVHGW